MSIITGLPHFPLDLGVLFLGGGGWLCKALINANAEEMEQSNEWIN